MNKQKFLQALSTLLILALPCIATAMDELKIPQPGSTAPSANIFNSEGQQVSLAEIISGKPTLLIFFRGGWCPYCNLHLSEVQKIEPELTKLGIQVLALSPDKHELIKKNTEKNKLSYLLLSLIHI